MDTQICFENSLMERLVVNLQGPGSQFLMANHDDIDHAITSPALNRSPEINLAAEGSR